MWGGGFTRLGLCPTVRCFGQGRDFRSGREEPGGQGPTQSLPVPYWGKGLSSRLSPVGTCSRGHGLQERVPRGPSGTSLGHGGAGEDRR